MQNLIIIGAGSFGREVFSWSKQCQTYFNFKGFLDNRPNILDNYNYPKIILGSSETYIPEQNDVFICALGDPMLKKTLCEKLLLKGAIFTNIIHKSVHIANNVKLGIGIIVCPNTILSSDCQIKDFVNLNMSINVGHDVIIGKYCQINSNSTLSGFSELGDESVMHGHSYLLPSIKIGKNCIVGAGSVVLKNVNNNCTVYGNPARIISKNQSI